MKIAFVIATFPPKVGGMGEVAYQEANNLAAFGHEVTVFTLAYRDSNLTADKSLPFKVARLHTPILLGDAGFIPQLLFKLADFDIVHLHYPFYGGAFLVFIACFVFRIPYVVTYHMDAKPFGFLKRIIKSFSDHLAAKLILRRAKKVIVVDTKNKQQFSFLKELSPSTVIEISNAVDTEVFHHFDISREQLGYKKLIDKKVLLFVGNLLAVKRLDLVLQALKKLNDRDLILLVVGAGYEREKYFDLSVKLGLSDRVIFLGQILDKDLLAKYYSVSDATVIPSDYESFSLVALESLACATPVIASKIEGVAGRISEGEDGLFFIPGDVDDLAQKVRLFFSRPPDQRHQMGKSGMKKVAASYSWAKHTAELLKVYQDK